MNAPIPPLARYRPDAPASLDAVLARTLARDREARFPDAETMGRALDAVLREDLGAPSRAEVAEVMRHQFGEIVEENRRAVRRFAAERDAREPMHLSTQGTFRPGGSLTLAPSVSAVNVRDLGIPLEEPSALRVEVLETLRDAPIATGGDAAAEWDVPTDNAGVELPDDNDTVQTSREELAAMGFAVSAPVAFAPTVRPSMPSFAGDELAPPPPPPPPVANLPAAPVYASYPPAAQAFDALPSELLAAQEAERRRRESRRRLENAVGWTILVAVLAGLGAVVYANRAWIEGAVGELRTGASADPSREGAFILRVTSDPSGATVFEDGVELGRTPLELQVVRQVVSQRPRQFVLRLAGRVDTRVLVGNHPTPRAELRVALPPASPPRR